MAASSEQSVNIASVDDAVQTVNAKFKSNDACITNQVSGPYIIYIDIYILYITLYSCILLNTSDKYFNKFVIMFLSNGHKLLISRSML